MGLFGIDKTSNEENIFNQQVALNNGGIGISGGAAGATIIDGDVEVAKGALDVARQISNSAYETVQYISDYNSRFQDRALNTVDRAVTAAQDVALTATPVSPGAYAEASADQLHKSITTFAVVLGGVFLLATLVKK